jgi:hypothetical protein
LVAITLAPRVVGAAWMRVITLQRTGGLAVLALRPLRVAFGRPVAIGTLT